MYTYNAKVVRVLDGDTVEFLVDLGFNIFVKEKFRLFGIDTPEKSGLTKESGLKSKEFAEEFLSKQEEYKIVVSKKDKYGRWLCSVFNKKDICLNEELVLEGLATLYFGGTK